jgi:antitoxin component of RelBE/YafQ-DinJ toxin-antitoxin module
MVTNSYSFKMWMRNSIMNGSSSTVRSFRIDKSLSEILNAEAERMGISVNAMINSVLKQYAEFTRFQSKLDMIIVNREVFKSLLGRLEDDDSYNFGLEMGKDIPNDTILFWKKDITFNGVLEYIEKIVCTYGYIGTYDELNTSEYKIIVIRHRLEGSGSKFLSGFFRSLLRQTLGIDAEIDITEYSVKIKIRLSK